MRKIGVIYTVEAIIEDFQTRLQETFGDIEWISILDEEILTWIREDNRPTPRQINRMALHVENFKQQGVEGIISTCSTLGDIMQSIEIDVELPIYRIDEPMFLRALEEGENITLLATAKTTVTPSQNYIKYLAKRDEKNIVLHTILEEVPVGQEGDMKVWARRVEKEMSTYGSQDAVVLAQASMARFMKEITEVLNVPVFASPDLFIDYLRQIIGGE